MRKIVLLGLIAVITFSCNVNMNKRIKGNGNVTTETREVDEITRIKIRGGINVDLVPGNSSSVKVEADENLQKYIIVKNEDGWLVVRTKDNVNLKSTNPIKVYVSADMINSISIAGSGNLHSEGKFTGAGKLEIDVAGSGDVDMDVNTPRVFVDIAGSGNVKLAGETKDARINIAGSGNYEAADLLTETTDIDIAGSGDAKVHADISLKADVFGSGNIYYRGKASVRSNSTGSGKVKPMD